MEAAFVFGDDCTEVSIAVGAGGHPVVPLASITLRPRHGIRMDVGVATKSVEGNNTPECNRCHPQQDEKIQNTGRKAYHYIYFFPA